MIQIDTQVSSLLPMLWQAFPFRAVPAKQRAAIVSKLRLCTFEPGQVIYAPHELPSAVHCIVQGCVRILGPESHHSPTLDVVEKGTVIGWDSLLRRTAAGSVRAALNDQSVREMMSASVMTLALSADEFESIALQYLMPELQTQVSTLEVFDTLARFLETRPHHHPADHLNRIVQFIQRHETVTVQHWHAGDGLRPTGGHRAGPASEFSALALANLESTDRASTGDRLWLLSGGEALNLAIGSPVEADHPLSWNHPIRFPARLLGFRRSVITTDAFFEAQMMSKCLASELSDEFLDEFSDLPDAKLYPTRHSQGLQHSLPPMPQLPQTRETTPYPIRRSRTPELIEDVIACFGMVCDRFQIPFRPDPMRNALRQVSVDHIPPFDLYLRLAQSLGLNAQMVRFTPTAGGLNRLTTPALIQYRDMFVVLHDITPTTAVLGSPRTGLLRLTAKDLATRLAPAQHQVNRRINQQTNNLPRDQHAIILERFATTPTQRFGFDWFWPLLTQQRRIWVQVILTSSVIQLLGLANPLLVQQVIDQVIINANAGAIPVFGGLMVAFALLEGVLTILRTFLLMGTTNRMDLHLGVEIVRHLLHLPLSFFEQRSVGDLSSRLLELENIRQFMTDTAITTVMDVAFSIFYIGIMLLYSPRLTVCVLATVPVVIISTLLMSKYQQKLIRKKAEQGAKVQSYMVETLGGITSVKAQHMEAWVEATWRDRYVQYLSSGFTTATVNTIFYAYNQFLNTLSSLLVLWVGADLVLQGELSLGGLIAFRILTGYVTGPLLRLARLWQRVQETALSMDLLADIANAPTETELTQQHTALPAIAGQINYHDISFGFKPNALQLTSIDLAITPGTFVGIVGQSGSGKSTLMKLLPRLYNPQSGHITIDGYDISKVDLSSLRSQIGIVSQDSVLFQGTIRDNIAQFADLPEETIIAAAKIAEAHDFILELPDGYNTQVGERGASLSGGQRQRIAIARIITRNPRLLIFDEATSALDYETERRVCENLMQHFQGCTCFFITHRLNTIVSADWILFMQSGIITEQGTHNDLMARRQRYACLFAQQSHTEL